MSTPATASTTPITTSVTAAMVRGAADLETTDVGLLPHRLPAWVRARHDDPQLRTAESQPSGVRVAVRTAATAITLRTRRTTVVYPGTPDRPAGTYDLLVDGRPVARAHGSAGRRLVVDLRDGSRTLHDGPAAAVVFPALPAGDKDVEIWLPHAETTELAQRRADDPHLHLVDGRDLYGPAEHERDPLPDGLHPSATGHRTIAERFAAVLRDQGHLAALGRA